MVSIAVAVCFMAILGINGTAAQASPSTDNDARQAALVAAEAASANGDGAALEAAKQFAPASFLYCNARYAYYTTNYWTYVPEFQSASMDTMRCYLESGTNGLGVSTLQSSLKYCYGKSIAVDGAFGPATYNALMQVQSSLGVTIDGIYGPGTGAAMKHAGTLPCRNVPASFFS